MTEPVRVKRRTAAEARQENADRLRNAVDRLKEQRDGLNAKIVEIQARLDALRAQGAV